ncbi:hypothetical protein [Streptomyces sp. NPDC001985]|uniref:hypothetical protein n=1 Tax=Streptomyces sp. NPDC001985 TaxID=3154406 RepID=UPI00331CA62A
MSAVRPEATVETAADDFAELDGLEVIESSELKIGGAYHSYTYITAGNEEDVLR